MKTAILQRMAKTLLSKDELEQIDREAEERLGNLEDEQPTEVNEREMAD